MNSQCSSIQSNTYNYYDQIAQNVLKLLQMKKHLYSVLNLEQLVLWVSILNYQTTTLLQIYCISPSHICNQSELAPMRIVFEDIPRRSSLSKHATFPAFCISYLAYLELEPLILILCTFFFQLYPINFLPIDSWKVQQVRELGLGDGRCIRRCGFA